MKKSILAFTVMSLVSIAVLADRKDTKVVEITNSEIEDTVNLKVETYKTEFYSEWVSDTCYRDVCSGYKEVCSWSSETCTNDRDCEINDGVRSCSVTPVCSGGGYSCDTVQDCGSESYDCSHYVNTPYEVFDHNTEAAVRVILKDVGVGLSLNEKLSVWLNGDRVSITSNSKSSNALLIGSLSSTENVVGGVKSISAVISINAVSISEATDPLAQVKVEDVKDGILTIRTKDLKAPDLFMADIKIVKPKFLARDPVLASGRVSLLDSKLIKEGQRQIDLSKIGLEWAKLPAGKYKVSVKLGSAIVRDSIINPGVLPAKMSSEDSVKFKKK